MRNLLLIVLSLCLIGCAQLNEQVSLMQAGGDTSGVPPGHFSFERGKKFAEQNNYEHAASNFCYAADLGHPQAKPYCVKYAILSAQEDPSDICRAKNYDDKAKELCADFVLKGSDYVRTQAVNMVVEQQSHKQTNKTKRKSKKDI